MVYTKGSTVNIYAVKEDTYGVCPASDQTHPTNILGRIITFNSPDSVSVEEIPSQGQRTRSDVVRTGHNVQWDASVNLTADMLGYLLGYTSMAKDEYSFSALVKADSDKHLFTGSMIDTLSLSATNIGELVTADISCKARWHAVGTAQLKDADGQTTLNEPNANTSDSGAPVTFNNQWKWKAGNGSYAVLNVKSWKLTVSENLQAVAGLSANANGFRLDNGQKSIPQALGIELELTIQAGSSEWDARRTAFAKDLSFQLPIGGRTVTLTGCNLDAAGPTRQSSGSYDETIKAVATTMTVA